MADVLVYRNSPEHVKRVSNRLALWIAIAMLVQSVVYARFGTAYSLENQPFYGMLYFMVPVAIFAAWFCSRAYKYGRLREQVILDDERITIRNPLKTFVVHLSELKRVTARTNRSGDVSTLHLHSAPFRGKRLEPVEAAYSLLDEIRVRAPHVQIALKRRRINYCSHGYFALITVFFLIGWNSLLFAAVYI